MNNGLLYLVGIVVVYLCTATFNYFQKDRNRTIPPSLAFPLSIMWIIFVPFVVISYFFLKLEDFHNKISENKNNE
jgi:hypothetical protein